MSRPALFPASANRRLPGCHPIIFARFVLFPLLLGLTSLARGMSIAPPPFETLVNQAERIARVQILERHAEFDATGARPLIHTYVRCRILRSLKGAGETEVTLRFLGGQVGSRKMTVVDMPQLAAGESYVLFISANGSNFCPLTAAAYGAYALVPDSTSGSARVARLDGTPLTGATDVTRALGPLAPARAQAMSTGLSLDEFESAIVATVHQPANR